MCRQAGIQFILRDRSVRINFRAERQSSLKGLWQLVQHEVLSIVRMEGAVYLVLL